MVKCGRCRHENGLGRIFCTQCGAKLDAEAEVRRELNQADKASFRARAIRFLLLDALVFVLVVAVLVFWPAAKSLDAPDAVHLAKAKAKILLLDRGLRESESFSEVEINSVIDDRFGKRLEKAGASIEVFVKPDLVTVVARSEIGPWNLGAFSLGPFPFTYTVRGRPEHKDGVFVFTPESGAVGHMPLFLDLKEYAVAPMAELFAGRENVRAFMNRIKRFDLKDGKVEAVIKVKSEP